MTKLLRRGFKAEVRTIAGISIKTFLCLSQAGIASDAINEMKAR